jgi:Do/DeqQ family serine protease
MKRFLELFSVAILGGLVVVGLNKYSQNNGDKALVITENTSDFSSENESSNHILTSNTSKERKVVGLDFKDAAAKIIPAVVHVRNTRYVQQYNPYDIYFGRQYSNKVLKQEGTGSGVIISPDGYIITNNHVIKGASELEITLSDKKTYQARVVGKDIDTDIALLKIDATDLPSVSLTDSDNIQIGEWVLAVGNPFNLNTTVTAGIVSAKSRDLEGSKKIDSFIQTDAVVNPGNSGGALVNTQGDLVGINTMIYSGNGSYIGYSFAVPSNIVKKIVEDILEFGYVQKAVLGLKGVGLNAKIAEKLNISQTEGVIITEITSEQAADLANLQKNDIIIAINQIKINTFADLIGYLKSRHPNEEVSITYLRDNEQYEVSAKLSKNNKSYIADLGIEIANLNKLNTTAKGVKVTAVFSQVLKRNGISSGYILTEINGQAIFSIDDVTSVITNKKPNEYMKITFLDTNGELVKFIFR